jgi:TRAP-type C4-dicarboxylate transport system permease small subunit
MRILAATLEGLLTIARNAAMGLAAVLILAMALLGSADVLTTAAFSYPIALAQELAELILSMTVFLVLPIAQYRREHIEVDIVARAFGPRGQLALDAFGNLVGFAFMAALTLRLWALAWESYEMQQTAVALLHFPIWPAKFVCGFGATAATLESLRDFALAVAALAGRER